MHVHPNYYIKIFTFFSSQNIKMNTKNINYNDKKIKKRHLQKQKSISDR